MQAPREMNVAVRCAKDGAGGLCMLCILITKC